VLPGFAVVVTALGEGMSTPGWFTAKPPRKGRSCSGSTFTSRVGVERPPRSTCPSWSSSANVNRMFVGRAGDDTVEKERENVPSATQLPTPPPPEAGDVFTSGFPARSLKFWSLRT
jgi:hypothetical protein